MNTLISFKHVYKTYDSDRHALRDISFDINKSDLVFLTGPSGAGKTTLFKLISLQEKISNGQLLINNKAVNDFNIFQKSDYRKKLGIVFQDFGLIPDLTLFDNIAVPLVIQKMSKKQIHLAVNEILEKFNLKDYATSYPDYISGGEKQRAAIARAIIHKPDFVIADEPTGNLDRKNANTVIAILKDLTLKGVAVIVATHDEELLKQKDVKQIYLENGQINKSSSL
jgi:cell division transport system ATP-binding protein